MHILGMKHEHNRCDRDNCIDINWNNIKSKALSQFHKDNCIENPESQLPKCSANPTDRDLCSTGDWVTHYGLPYDCRSILHYSNKAFAKNNTIPVYTPVGGSTCQEGHTTCGGSQLSTLDKKKLNTACHCPGHGCGGHLTQSEGILDTFEPNSTNCDWLITAIKEKSGRQLLRMFVEKFHAPDCDKCALTVDHKISAARVYCGANIPTVFITEIPNVHIHFTKTDPNCGFRLVWRKIRATDACCNEVEFTATSPAYAATTLNSYLGIYNKQSYLVNDKPFYYKDGDSDVKWLANYGGNTQTPWILSRLKYATPGSNLGVMFFKDSRSECAEHTYKAIFYDPLTLEFTEESHPTKFMCTTVCTGPPPTGPPGSTSDFTGDMSDLAATYEVGRTVTYTCPSTGFSKFAMCDPDGEWWSESLSNCNGASVEPPPVIPPKKFPKPPNPPYRFMKPNTWVRTLTANKCFIVKSHRQWSQYTYGPRIKSQWRFKIHPSCKRMRVKFIRKFFHINGDIHQNCTGDSLTIHQRHHWNQRTVICGNESPKDIYLRGKTKIKYLTFKSKVGYANTDGFQAYVCAKRCA